MEKLLPMSKKDISAENATCHRHYPENVIIIVSSYKLTIQKLGVTLQASKKQLSPSLQERLIAENSALKVAEQYWYYIKLISGIVGVNSTV